MITEDKVIEFFCIMNEFCKKFASNVEKKDSNKKFNDYSPHSSSGECRVPQGLSKPPLSAIATKCVQAHPKILGGNYL